MENVLTDTPVPQLHDSHSENIRLDSSFLAFFRQSLLHNTNYCADPVCCSIFEIPNTSPLYRSPNTVTTAGLRYPLLLFEDLLHILPNSDLSQRAIDFDARVLPSLPFLSRISSLTAAATNERNGADLSLHMGLCKALLGSSADDNSHYGALWHATTSLILGAFEIDNSVGRRLTWLTSAVLIVASGGMQTDPLVRYRTAIVNGCVQAFLFRSDNVLRPHKTTGTESEVSRQTEITSLRSFYFLCETIRSIHHHTPLTFGPNWSVPLGSGGQYDLRDLSEDLVVDEQELPSDLTIADYLLVLIQLLADTNNLLCTWASFTQEMFTTHDLAFNVDSSFSGHQQNETTSNNRTIGIQSHEPYLPLTADREYNRIRTDLMTGLLLWESSFQRAFSSNDSQTKLSMTPLLYLAKLLLNLGAGAFLLPSLSGYSVIEFGNSHIQRDTPIPPHRIGIRLDDAAVQIAADILNSINHERSFAASNSHATTGIRTPCPMWYPFALFYSALVIWGRLEADKAKKAANHVLLPWRNLLQMLHRSLNELRGDYGCIIEMANVIQKLLTQDTSHWELSPS